MDLILCISSKPEMSFRHQTKLEFVQYMASLLAIDGASATSQRSNPSCKQPCFLVPQVSARPRFSAFFIDQFVSSNNNQPV